MSVPGIAPHETVTLRYQHSLKNMAMNGTVVIKGSVLINHVALFLAVNIVPYITVCTSHSCGMCLIMFITA